VPVLTVKLLNVALAAIAAEDDRTKINAVTKNSNRLTMINFVSAKASYSRCRFMSNYIQPVHSCSIYTETTNSCIQFLPGFRCR